MTIIHILQIKPSVHFVRVVKFNSTSVFAYDSGMPISDYSKANLITLYILKEETHNYVSFTHERSCLKPREESGIRTQSN